MSSKQFLSAKDSDPEVMGWMKGFPPPQDKILSVQDGTYWSFPGLRYSVKHMEEFFPVKFVKSATENQYTVKTNLDPNITSVSFTPWDSDVKMSFIESLDANYTDGLIIMHKGEIIYENYFAGLTQDGHHSIMSISKSFVGTIGAILVTQGLLDPEKMVIDYIPELKNSAYGDATVRQVMDMTTSIQYSEDYDNPKAEVWMYAESGNPFRPHTYNGPKNHCEYLQTNVKLEGENHGDCFHYKTVNSELLGWIVSRITNKDLTELVSELIWKPLGAHHDGFYVIDPAGMALAGGGLSINLRDMAMFGEMLRNNGKLNGKQVIPEAAVLDISKGGCNPEAQELFEKGGGYPKLKGWSYRDMWWSTNNSHGAYMARGVHGQAIYIDPKAEMVIARFASYPGASNQKLDPTSIPLYEAIADYLINKH